MHIQRMAPDLLGAVPLRVGSDQDHQLRLEKTFTPLAGWTPGQPAPYPIGLFRCATATRTHTPQCNCALAKGYSASMPATRRIRGGNSALLNWR